MFQDKQVVVNNLLTHYRYSGQGKTLLLLHGWGDSSQTFIELANLLATNFEVYIPDLPGFGKTQSPQETWSIPDYAKFVAEFTNKINVKPFGIIGHSNGGTIAIHATAQNILKPQKLVLMASAGIRSEYKGKKKALRLLAKGAKLATKPLPKSTQEKIKKRAYSAIGSDLFVAEHLQETFKQVVEYDVTAEVSKISIPTLLIYGDQDKATPVRYGELFKDKLDKGKLEILPGIGHFVHQEATDSVYSILKGFLV